MVYHGHTFTSKIPFREVVSTLGKYAFKVRHLPQVLVVVGGPWWVRVHGSGGGVGLRLTHLLMQQDWSHCGEGGGGCVTFWGIALGGLTYSLHCAVPGAGGHEDMDCWGAGVRWDMGDTGGLEGMKVSEETLTQGAPSWH